MEYVSAVLGPMAEEAIGGPSSSDGDLPNLNKAREQLKTSGGQRAMRRPYSSPNGLRFRGSRRC